MDYLLELPVNEKGDSVLFGISIDNEDRIFQCGKEYYLEAHPIYHLHYTDAGVKHLLPMESVTTVDSPIGIIACESCDFILRLPKILMTEEELIAHFKQY